MVVVIGGGEAGTHHARQLVRWGGADEVVVVDRDASCSAFRALRGITPVVADWGEYLRDWLGPGGAARVGDHVIPAPFAPHLLWEWLGAAVGARSCPAPGGWGLPFEVEGADGVRFLSAAAWTCPATCVEPAGCPVLHAPKDWDLASVIEERGAALGWVPAVFRCYELAMGVASVPVEALLGARERLRGASVGTRCLVATSSHCHAAIGGLCVGGGRSG